MQQRHDEQIEQGGCNQSTQHDNRQRMLDLVARYVASDHQRYEGQAGRQSGHQDRRESFLRAT
jgi:hypothetical protein